MNLRIPGPTPVPPEVLEATAHPMVNHRGEYFANLIQRVTVQLQKFFQTEDEVLILSASGTAGLEAAVVNTLSPGDSVLAISIGAFGDRFAAIAEAYGAQVTTLSYEWGKSADPQEIQHVLAQDGSIKAVLVTHNETSTGVTNPLEEIAQVVNKTDCLLIVDAVSSLGAIPVEVDSWNLGVAITGSQKGWMVPPGLAFVSMSDRAWEANKKAKMPRFYLDLARHRDFLAKGQTPWTPAISILYGLDIALEKMANEGLEEIFARHKRIGQTTREGVKSLGLELLCEEERFASDTVTAVKCPDSIEVSALRRKLEDEYDIVVAGGQGKLSGEIFRIGHLGFVSEVDIHDTIEALDKTLTKLGFRPN